MNLYALKSGDFEYISMIALNGLCDIIFNNDRLVKDDEMLGLYVGWTCEYRGETISFIYMERHGLSVYCVGLGHRPVFHQREIIEFVAICSE